LQEKKTNIEQQFSSEQKILEHYKASIPSVCTIREGSSLASLLDKDTYNIGQLQTVLQDEKVFLQEKIKTEETATMRAKQAAEEMSQKWTNAKIINDQFAQLEAKQKSLDGLLEEKDAYKEKEDKLLHAKRASQIIPYEEQYKEREKEKTVNAAAFTQAENALQLNKKSLDEAKIVYEAEKNKENERETARKKLEQLESFLPIVQEMDKQKTVIDNLEKEVEEASTAVKKIDETLIAKERQVEALKQTISTNEAKTKDKIALTERRNELESHYKLYRDYLKAKETEQKVLMEKNNKKEIILNEKNKKIKEKKKKEETLKQTITTKKEKTKDKITLTERRNELESHYKLYRDYLKAKETEQKVLMEKNNKEEFLLTEKKKYEQLE